LGPAWSFLPSNLSVVFILNHDLQRDKSGITLTEKDGITFELALIFMMAYPYGYLPTILSSYYFDDPLQGPPKSPVHDGKHQISHDSRSNVENKRETLYPIKCDTKKIMI